MWVLPCQTGWTTQPAGEGGNRKRNRGREREGGKRQVGLRTKVSKGERMEQRDALACNQRLLHTGTKDRDGRKGLQARADLLDLRKTAP